MIAWEACDEANDGGQRSVPAAFDPKIARKPSGRLTGSTEGEGSVHGCRRPTALCRRRHLPTSLLPDRVNCARWASRIGCT
jgi:hypothetical protein